MKAELAERFTKKAANDLKIAISELNTENPVYDMVCLHFQQYVEKNLKAYLIINEIEFPRTHNLIYLLNLCSETDSSFKQWIDTKLVALNTCGVEIRYDDYDEISKEFIEEIYPIVIKFKEFIGTKFNNIENF